MCTQEGKVAEAESLKLKLEQAQRERRQMLEEMDQTHKPKWFEKPSTDGVSTTDDSTASSSRSTGKTGDQWLFKGDYWDLRKKDPGFQDDPSLNFVKLW